MIPMELLLSVCVIGALMLMVTILIDKSVVLPRSRDLLRMNHVQRLTSAILQYQVDHAGALPTTIEGTEQEAQMIAIPGEICTDVCKGQKVKQECLDLANLVPAYLDTIPQDPFFTQLGPSGYYIYKHQDHESLTIGACNVEVGDQIQSTR